MRSQFHQLTQLFEPQNAIARDQLLDEIIASSADGRENDSEKMLSYFMAANLRNRFSGTGITENLYESTKGVSQIRLFDILIHQFPFVKYSQQMTNEAIVNILKQEQEACIIDIGIGMGTQMLHVLDRARELGNLRKLTIVGIEPFESALRTATEKIEQYKRQLNFELEFLPILSYIEHIDLSAYKPANTPCIVNASLALHHVKSSADRDRIIAGIKALEPTAVLLIEPNVDHFTNDLAKRIHNAYDHFIGVFRVIDRLDASNEDKNGLKLFFGRELEDILSKARDEERFEKHEPATTWLKRLQQNGLTPATKPLLNENKEVLGVKIEPMPAGYVGFTEQHETILAVMCAS